MKDKKNRPASDLLFQLNLSRLLSQARGFLSLNLLLVLLGLFFLAWKVDHQAQLLGRQLLEEASSSHQLAGYRIQKARPVQGLTLPDWDLDGGSRSLYRRPGGSYEDCWSYQLSLGQGSQQIRLSYSLGPDLRLLGRLGLVLLLAQLILLVSSAWKEGRKTRASLQPLADLAQTARTLNQAGRSPVDQGQLENLAQIVRTIDADKLDRKIALEGPQDEIKDLASAINDMLHRVDQAYQAQIRFVSDASHELRTPIAVIQGYAGLLARWGKDDPAALEEAIEAIRGEAEAMQALVDQLLFLARGDNESLKLTYGLIDLAPLLEDLVRENQLLDSRHSFQLDLQGLVEIWGDGQLIKQLLRILVDNSIKYSPDGGRISLRAWTQGQQVRIQVQDQGQGMGPEDLAHVFERFYRSDESRARQGGGTGLGLAIARWIVDQHQGQVEIFSRLGLGTRVSLSFPSGAPAWKEEERG